MPALFINISIWPKLSSACCAKFNIASLQFRSVTIVLISSPNSDAKSISLTNVVDPSIIGGFIIRYDGKEYNASVKQNLNNLKKELTN